MPLTIINAAGVRKLLPMSECIDAMEPAMIAATTGAISMPPRLVAPLIDESGTLVLMPGSSTELAAFGAKVINLIPDNPARGLPAIQGFIALFDYDSGTPVALIDGAEVTGIRTAAASGLATRLLARPDACSCGIFGNGVQAVTHIDAMRAVRPVDEIIVWGRNPDKVQAFAREQAQRTGIEVRATVDPAEAGACDLVCTTTTSPEPVLAGEWVRPGAHVNLVGAHSLTTRECDTGLVVKSSVYVDLMESVRNEGGDIMIPVQEGAIDETHVIGELGELLQGKIPGRQDDRQVTLYQSHGINAQDMFAAKHIHAKAQATGDALTVEF